MASKKKPARNRGRTPKTMMLAIPEDVVARLIDPDQVSGGDDAEVARALTNQIDVAVGEIAEALVAAGRPLASLHALRTAAEEHGFRRGYRDGARAVGWAVHALARDLPRGARKAE